MSELKKVLKECKEEVVKNPFLRIQGDLNYG
jgi:hypothetical protein